MGFHAVEPHQLAVLPLHVGGPPLRERLEAPPRTGGATGSRVLPRPASCRGPR